LSKPQIEEVLDEVMLLSMAESGLTPDTGTFLIDKRKALNAYPEKVFAIFK